MPTSSHDDLSQKLQRAVAHITANVLPSDLAVSVVAAAKARRTQRVMTGLSCVVLATFLSGALIVLVGKSTTQRPSISAFANEPANCFVLVVNATSQCLEASVATHSPVSMPGGASLTLSDANSATTTTTTAGLTRPTSAKFVPTIRGQHFDLGLPRSRSYPKVVLGVTFQVALSSNVCWIRPASLPKTSPVVLLHRERAGSATATRTVLTFRATHVGDISINFTGTKKRALPKTQSGSTAQLCGSKITADSVIIDVQRGKRTERERDHHGEH